MKIAFGATAMVVGALMCASGSTAFAQNYPTKPIRFIVGPGSDLVPRLLGQKLSGTWGQQVVVEVRPGGGGVIATELVAKSPPDGYTLLNTTGSYTINSGLYSNLPYDFVRDLAPVTLNATLPLVLVVHPSLPVHSVQNLIKLARAKPGQLNCASSGNGTSAHLACEMLRTVGKVQTVHVPYKGLPAASTALIGGHVEMLFVAPVVGFVHIRSGRMRALGLTSRERLAAAPEIAPIAELGIADYSYESWNGVHVPAGTPKTIIAKLNAEIVNALRLTDVRDRLQDLGMAPVGNTPEEFAAFVKEDLTRTANVIKASGMRVD